MLLSTMLPHSVLAVPQPLTHTQDSDFARIAWVAGTYPNHLCNPEGLTLNWQSVIPPL